jgi:hypothetical protein
VCEKGKNKKRMKKGRLLFFVVVCVERLIGPNQIFNRERKSPRSSRQTDRQTERKKDR